METLEAEARVIVQDYLKFIGLVWRSTDLRNAFEFYFPLERLVRRIIGDSAQLVLSSEWDFVPFAYPLTIDELPEFVLVGLPASESGNPLLVPIAGHEIGHAAWRHHRRLPPVLTLLIDHVRTMIGEQRGRRPLSRKDLYVNGVAHVAAHQAEEIFCDLFGLYIFGEAYVHAFSYFMAPGSTTRANQYPSAPDRLKYLKQAAKRWRIAFPRVSGVGWQRGEPRNQHDELIDKAVNCVVPDLADMVRDLLRQDVGGNPMAKLNDRDVIARSEAAFRAGRPCRGALLSEIVAAGWRVLHEPGKVPVDFPEGYNTLLDLMLKSIEIAEYEHLRERYDAKR